MINFIKKAFQFDIWLTKYAEPYVMISDDVSALLTLII